MNRLFFRLGVILVLLTSFSCASPIANKLQEMGAPRYQGTITPISIPITPEYKPVKSTFTMGVKGGALGSSKSVEIHIDGKIAVSQMGDMLLWNLIVLGYKNKNGSFRPNLPIADLRYLTDKSGGIKEAEFAFPALEKAGQSPISSTEEYKGLIREAKKMIPPLTSNPVRTGDVISRTPYFFSIDKDFPDMLGHPNEFKDKYVESIVKGWVYYEGHKVIVAEVNETFSFSKSQWTLTGYSLFDWRTFQVVKLELIMKIRIAAGTLIFKADSSQKIN